MFQHFVEDLHTAEGTAFVRRFTQSCGQFQRIVLQSLMQIPLDAWLYLVEFALQGRVVHNDQNRLSILLQLWFHIVQLERQCPVFLRQVLCKLSPCHRQICRIDGLILKGGHDHGLLHRRALLTLAVLLTSDGEGAWSSRGDG